MAANRLGLTTQVPIKEIYLTSGPTYIINIGAHAIHLKHAKKLELLYLKRPAGEAIRALSSLGPSEVTQAISKLRRILPEKEFHSLTYTTKVPTWMAQSLCQQRLNG